MDTQGGVKAPLTYKEDVMRKFLIKELSMVPPPLDIAWLHIIDEDELKARLSWTRELSLAQRIDILVAPSPTRHEPAIDEESAENLKEYLDWVDEMPAGSIRYNKAWPDWFRRQPIRR